MISVIENPTLSSSNSEASDFHDAKRERIVTRLGKFRRKRTKIPARNSSRLYMHLLTENLIKSDSIKRTCVIKWQNFSVKLLSFLS